MGLFLNSELLFIFTVICAVICAFTCCIGQCKLLVFFVDANVCTSCTYHDKSS